MESHRSFIFRCANAGVYVLMAIGVVAAMVWAVWSSRLQGHVQLALAHLGCAVVVFWAAHYFFLSYRVSSDSIARRTLLRGKEVRSLDSALSIRAQRQESRGIISCAVMFRFPDAEWTISSDLFAPDDVLDLADELAKDGILEKSADSEMP